MFTFLKRVNYDGVFYSVVSARIVSRENVPFIRSSTLHDVSEDVNNGSVLSLMIDFESEKNELASSIPSMRKEGRS